MKIMHVLKKLNINNFRKFSLKLWAILITFGIASSFKINKLNAVARDLFATGFSSPAGPPPELDFFSPANRPGTAGGSSAAGSPTDGDPSFVSPTSAFSPADPEATFNAFLRKRPRSVTDQFESAAGGDGSGDVDEESLSSPARKPVIIPDETETPATEVFNRKRRLRKLSNDGGDVVAAINKLDAAIRANPAKYADGSPAKRMCAAKQKELAAALGSPDRWASGDGIFDTSDKLKPIVSPDRSGIYHERLLVNPDRATALAHIFATERKLVDNGVLLKDNPALVIDPKLPLSAYAVFPTKHVQERHISPRIMSDVRGSEIHACAASGELVVTPRDPRTGGKGKPAAVFSFRTHGIDRAGAKTRMSSVLSSFADPHSKLIGHNFPDDGTRRELYDTPKGYMATIAPAGPEGDLRKDTVFPVHVTRFDSADVLSGIQKPVYVGVQIGKDEGVPILLSSVEALAVKNQLVGKAACRVKAISSYSSLDSDSKFFDLTSGIDWAAAGIPSPKMGVLVEIPN